MTYEKPTYIRHTPCSMMLLLYYSLEFIKSSIFSFFHEGILPVLRLLFYYYYHLRSTCMYICLVVCIYIQLCRKEGKRS